MVYSRIGHFSLAGPQLVPEGTGAAADGQRVWVTQLLGGRKNWITYVTLFVKKLFCFAYTKACFLKNCNSSSNYTKKKKMQRTELNSFWKIAGVKCQGRGDSVDQKQATTTWKSRSSTQQDISWCGTAQAVWLARVQNGNTPKWTHKSNGPSTGQYRSEKCSAWSNVLEFHCWFLLLPVWGLRSPKWPGYR